MNRIRSPVLRGDGTLSDMGVFKNDQNESIYFPRGIKMTTDRIILVISVINMFLVLYMIWRLMKVKECYEVVIPHANGDRKFQPPPNFNATISNSEGTYKVDTHGRLNMDLDVTKIYLHKPGDEPMLKYYIKDNLPIVSNPVKPGVTVNVYLMEKIGCWKSTVPVVLPTPGNTVEMEMTYADCI